MLMFLYIYNYFYCISIKIKFEDIHENERKKMSVNETRITLVLLGSKFIQKCIVYKGTNRIF
jgi:hypothetical protein